MIVRKAFKFRLEPKHHQTVKLVQFSGCCRFVWNHALALIKNILDEKQLAPRYCQLASMLIGWKNEFAFLKDANAQALQQTLKNLDLALKQAFDKTSPKRFPRFKKRGQHDAFRCPQGFKLNGNSVYLPKIGWVRFRKSQNISGLIKNVTVSKRGEHWFVSFQTEQHMPDPTHQSVKSVGIDLGIKRLATLSNGQFFEPLNAFKSLKATLAKEQRKLAKKVKFSSNWVKQKKKINKIHTQIKDMRLDHLHKITTNICKNHAIVVVEDLKVSNMSASASGTLEDPGKNVAAKSGLNRSILDQGWFEFRRQCEYKLNWLGGTLVKIPPHHTSQTCSKCGCVNADNRPTQERFKCVKCGFESNADDNAALNILRAGHARIACGEATMVGSVKQEPPVKSGIPFL